MARSKLKKPSSQFTQHNSVQLVRGAGYFERLLHIIAHAKQTLYLQTYIFEDDETGRIVADALLQAAKRSVQVYVMVDAYASHTLPKHFIEQLEQGGINFRLFQPFFKSKYFYIGRRMHHKLLVADAAYCLVGGINIGNKYNDMPGQPAWLDFALYCHGPVALEVCHVARTMWKGFGQKAPSSVCAVKEDVEKPGDASGLQVRVRRNDWAGGKSEITQTYREMFAKANSHITILCSYFMPGNLVKKYILRATKRGVQIRVIMAGRSDVAMAKNAERFMYDWLLRNGVVIYEYQSNILHGKLAVCDEEWMTVGSYNINNISAYASVELNLDVNDAAFAKSTEKVLDDIIAAGCTHVVHGYTGKKRSLVQQFINWCSYEIIRLLFFLFTFYFRQRRF